jgi:hypothetical protein
MATVEKATLGMFDEIHTLLKGFNNPRLGANEWRGLFTYPWFDDAEAPGVVLLDGGKVVGFLGTIYSRRCIDGKMEKFCNATSWIVEPGFRGESVKMLLPLMRMLDCTVTNFSPSATVTKIFEQLGFRYLDTHARIFFPLPQVWRLFKRSAYTLVTDSAQIPALVGEQDRKLFQDHSGFKCGHIALSSGRADERYCYCIYTNIIRNKLHFNHIQYVSDPALFREHAQRIGFELFKRTGTPFMKVDCRLLGPQEENIPGSFRFRVTSPRMYKSEGLKAAQVDNLYSELVILNL